MADAEMHVGFCDPRPMWYYLPRYSMTRPEKEMRAEVYLDQSRAASLLIDRTYDVLVSYGAASHADVESVPLVHEYFMLSVD